MQFSFVDYALDVDRRELTRGSELIALGPQVFDLLVYLVKNRERVVSKDDLIEGVGRTNCLESTLTSHINAVRKAVGDSGDEQKLIRTVARKGFRFVGDVTEENAPAKIGAAKSPPPRNIGDANAASLIRRRTTVKPPPALILPDKPSIAVLPFQNLSGDSEQEYFADGIVEDIITALSRMRWLFVIARNSSFTYKGRAVDVKQVGRELGVRYVLEGSVRKAANRVRITGQLIDASTGAHLWADRFEGDFEDIFDLQDRITAERGGRNRAEAGAGRDRARQTQANRKPRCLRLLPARDGECPSADQRGEQRGVASVLQGDRTRPEFASAYGMAAWCYIWRKMNGWMVDREKEGIEGARLAKRAVELGKEDAVALSRGGHALAWFTRDLDAGAAYIDRALVLNPNLAAAWNLSGWVRAYRGEIDLAIEHHKRGMRLSPIDPALYNMHVGMAFAHFLARRYDDASSWAQKALQEQPNYPTANRILAASYALAGQLGEAQQAMSRLRPLDPERRISNLSDVSPATPTGRFRQIRGRSAKSRLA